MAFSLGVDLGTTYSAAATMRSGRPEIFQLGQRAATIPSVVVLRADGEVLTGDAAERRALAEPTRTAREFKRRLGDPTPIILGGTPYGAEALLAHLLGAIVGLVTEQMGEAPASIVLCHPASYGAYKLDLLRQAVRLADVGDVSLIAEPEAAALHYAIEERVPAGAAVAVYDLGGGTFDATVLRTSAAGFELIGRPEGMERLGGIDFDEAVFRHVLECMREAGLEPDTHDPATLPALARLREECRRAKEALSSDTDTTIAAYLPGASTDVRLTRAEFEAMIRPRIVETIGALGRAVRSAELDFGALDRILLVGGSSRIPLVGEMVREATGRPVALDAHPKHTMALGAAYSARQGVTGATPQVRRGTTTDALGAAGRGTDAGGTDDGGTDDGGSDRPGPGIGEVGPAVSPPSTVAAGSGPRRTRWMGTTSADRRMPVLAAIGLITLVLVAAGIGLAALSGGITRTPEPRATEAGGVAGTPGAHATEAVSLGPQPVVVPTLVGLREGAAVSALEAAGLVPGVRRGAFHPTAPVGEVIDQSPSPGAELLPGEAVDYTVSAGPQPVVVPGLLGLREGAAVEALEAAGLAPGVRRAAFHPTAPVGEVIDQSPSPGAELLPGEAVDYTVSAGPQPVVVPTLVGLREEAAVSALLAAGLVPGVRREAFHPTAPVGEVIDQSPSPGAELLPGEAVDYTVSAPRPAPSDSSMAPDGSGGPS